MIPSFHLPATAMAASYLLVLLLAAASITQQHNVILVNAQPQVDTSSSAPTTTTILPARPTVLPTVSLTPSIYPSWSSRNPSPEPTIFVPTVSMTPSETPSFAPTRVPSVGDTFIPSLDDSSTNTTTTTTNNATSNPTERVCENTVGWAAPATFFQNGQYVQGIYDCDHPSISCQRTSRLGPATFHCCKCRPECCGQCNHHPKGGSFRGDPCSLGKPFEDDDDYGSYYGNNNGNQGISQEDSSGPLQGVDILRFIFSAMGITFCVIAALLAIRHQQSRELRDARRIMAERRRMQRERDEGGGGGEEPNNNSQLDMNARYEQIVTAFLFQNVNADKTNISAGSIRGETNKNETDDDDDADDGTDDEAPKEVEGEDTSSVTDEQQQQQQQQQSNTMIVEIGLSERLSTWRGQQQPSPPNKDECCICLDCYSPGETICVPHTSKECDHVFHEECIVEWLKNHTDCPLCRVELIGD